MAIYEGGAVGISIYPDTTEFGFELRRKLAKYADDSLTIPLNIDVDDGETAHQQRPSLQDRRGARRYERAAQGRAGYRGA